MNLDKSEQSKPKVLKLAPESKDWYDFKPEKEITAYEIRLVFGALKMKIDNNLYKDLDEHVKRYFVKFQEKND